MAHPTTPAHIYFKRTKELQGGKAFRKRVDALAGHERIEGPAVGLAAHPSEAYAAFQALIAASSDEQLEELLQHESPVVRGYVASWLARTYGPEHPALEPVREDSTEVHTLIGCLGGSITVSDLARGLLET